jgi:hypothetical protein
MAGTTGKGANLASDRSVGVGSDNTVEKAAQKSVRLEGVVLN